MDDLFFMTSLGSKSTGLPFPVWVSCGNSGTTRQEIAVWIGDRNPPVPSEMTYLEVGSEVRLIRGCMSDVNLDLLRTWIALNAEALQEHRNGDIDSADLIERLRRIQSPR